MPLLMLGVCFGVLAGRHRDFQQGELSVSGHVPITLPTLR
jgi:hypothetical protein